MSGPAESGAPAPFGTLEQALARAARLLETDAMACAEQAAEILRSVPGHPIALWLLGGAQRRCGRTALAHEILAPLAASQPGAAQVQYEFGCALADIGEPEEAINAWRRAVQVKPDYADAWRAIADELRKCGDGAGADAAYAGLIKAGTRDPRLLAAADALLRNDLPQAETLLRAHLQQHPTDVAAVRMFAEVAGRLRRYRDAENLLERCLELAPGFNAARYDYAVVLNRQGKAAAAMEQAEALLRIEPRNPGYRNLRAMVLARIGDYAQSIDIYAELLRAHPGQEAIWMNYGHALGAAGREADSIKAYRTCIRLAPDSGEAYWSLANLKTFRFTDAERDAMHQQLKRADLADAARVQFEFALGKALEDAARYGEAFAHYDSGNRLRRATTSYDPRQNRSHVERCKALLTREFFAARAGFGSDAADPIFIVGMPRAGSTLIEQVLASHPQIEGTAELPDIIAMARRLGGRTRAEEQSLYPAALAELSAAQCRELGEQYLQQTRIQRKQGTPFFIDKMPNNCMHVALIHLILPRARIIDARRHPMACCFSGFKQHFARGQNHTYSLEDIGQYYRDYVALMQHLDACLPGRVHRVIYEEMVEDTEAVVRRLLAYCGLDFDPACLRFYENRRAVRTASAQQVRQPIYREGLDQWRHFEPWLGPLRSALGELAGEPPRGAL
jgi:predicted Zn-dependent protease